MTETTPTGLPIIDCDQCGWRHPIERPHCTTCGKSSRFINEGLCLGCAKEEPGLESVLCSTCGHPGVGHQSTAKAANPERLPCHQDCTCEAFVPSTVAIPDEPNPGPRTPASWPVKPPSITAEQREELGKQAMAEGVQGDCHLCGHPALEHHGTDGRERSDAGCLAYGEPGDDWCRCPLTATQAAQGPEPQVCEPCALTDCRSCEGRTLLLDCQCAHSILEDS